MKLSLRWLSEFVDLKDQSPADIEQLLSLHVAEVEGIEDIGANLADVVVGEVLTCAPHPDADKLSITEVAYGAGEAVPVVCGAPNVRAGLKVAFAPVGSRLPGDLKIKKAKLRGQLSCGMICSARELELSEEHDGILELAPDATVGMPLVEQLDLGDHVFEIDNKSLTHRPDLWGHYGFARELAALLKRPLAELEVLASWPEQASTWKIERPAAEACPAYAALEIDPAGPPSASPEWLQRRLKAVGQRPLDLFVDLSNLVMLEIGQPTHAFDADTLHGHTIRVRQAQAGESLRTLDGMDRTLEPQDLVIADEVQAIALAGVMGGEATEVQPSTARILLESAVFQPTGVRRTAQRLALRSEASARFEKALDPALAEQALARFMYLLKGIRPQARALSAPARDGSFAAPERRLSFSPSAAAARLGMPASAAEQEDILKRLGFRLSHQQEDDWQVEVPSWRATKDVTASVDLLEEVGRHLGYHRIQPAPLVMPVKLPVEEAHRRLTRRLLLRLVQTHGACETQGYSFLNRDWAEHLGLEPEAFVRLANPVQAGVDLMRHDPMPSLLLQAEGNLREAASGRLCEAGKGYRPSAEGPVESRHLGLVSWGPRESPLEGAGSQFAALCSICRDLLRVCGRSAREACPEVPSAQSLPAWAHPAHALAWRHEGHPLAVVARLHPRLAERLGLDRSQVAGLCLDLAYLASCPEVTDRFKAPARFPGIKVDVALSLPQEVPYATVEQALRQAGGRLLDHLELFDLYRGEGLAPGHRSLAFRAILRAADRTLSDKEEQKFLAKAARVATELGGQVRG